MELHTKSSDNIRTFSPFFADTWWFGMTKRLSDDDFSNLVIKREEQGFTAAQIVVGIPPEVGVENENALSLKGRAWNLEGEINYKYLEFVRNRVIFMNTHNIMAIIYGAWGNQIDWIGKEKMNKWWNAIVDYLDDLDVLYCLTGESDLWVEPYTSKQLLPNKTINDIIGEDKVGYRIKKIIYQKFLKNMQINMWKKVRKKKWSYVLNNLAAITLKPIIIHTTPNIDGINAVSCPELLAANTFQTGHSMSAEPSMWKLLIQSKYCDSNKPVINLEPWYEGIMDDFYQEKQIKAFWLSVASGASALCYGAHGIWNVGDSVFLSHWGKQTFTQALDLKSPQILGKSFAILLREGVFSWNTVKSIEDKDELIALIRSSENGSELIYIPDLKKYRNIANLPDGKYLEINTAEFYSQRPCVGSVVIFVKKENKAI